MARIQHLGRTLLLAALVLGLNALGLLSAMHGRHPGHARANVTHGHHGSSRRASRYGDRYSDDALHAGEDHADLHVTPKSHKNTLAASLSAFIPQSFILFAPEFIDAPLANIAEVAVSSAPRAPGAARAPPLR